jgi:hypothetical protein
MSEGEIPSAPSILKDAYEKNINCWYRNNRI